MGYIKLIQIDSKENVLVALEMKVRWGVAVRYPPVRARPRAHLYSSLPSDFTTPPDG